MKDAEIKEAFKGNIQKFISPKPRKKSDKLTKEDFKKLRKYLNKKFGWSLST